MRHFLHTVQVWKPAWPAMQPLFTLIGFDDRSGDFWGGGVTSEPEDSCKDEDRSFGDFNHQLVPAYGIFTASSFMERPVTNRNVSLIVSTCNVYV